MHARMERVFIRGRYRVLNVSYFHTVLQYWELEVCESHIPLRKIELPANLSKWSCFSNVGRKMVMILWFSSVGCPSIPLISALSLLNITSYILIAFQHKLSIIILCMQLHIVYKLKKLRIQWHKIIWNYLNENILGLFLDFIFTVF
jgi:hypothetical protein